LKENYKANCKAHYKALDKALTKHTSKHLQSTLQSTCQSIDSINKQYYNTTNNKETNTNEAPSVLFPDQPEEILTAETEIQKKEKSSAKKEKNKPAEIPTMEDFVAYGKENKPNVQISALELKFKAWFANGWRTGKDKEIKNWKATLLNTLQFLPENMQPSTNGRSITDAMDTYNLLKR